ncbi:MAG: response regulator [Acidimicrobiales bacterium]|nr:response regulator [Acidimicrobiales bacterium]
MPCAATTPTWPSSSRSSSRPRTTCSTGSSPPPDHPQHWRATVPTRVVIAEDEAIIRLDLKETLEEEGYEVVAETGRGDEAVELVREHQPDVAILDIKMPGLDGLSAAREIAGERRAAVLILTAFSQRDLIERARDAGALAYLVKPFQKADLFPAIEVALGRFQELKALHDQATSLSDQLETRKTVDRAKGQLMDQAGLTEAAAFSFIQKTAMAERQTMKAVAQRVLDGELAPAQ